MFPECFEHHDLSSVSTSTFIPGVIRFFYAWHRYTCLVKPKGFKSVPKSDGYLQGLFAAPNAVRGGKRLLTSNSSG